MKPYRELTVAATLLGVGIGAVMTVAMTYAGLVIGFVVPCSAIAAILGWAILKGLGRGTIVENNVNQTVASAIQTTASGIIFTFPAMFLLPGTTVRPWAVALAGIAGALLGNLFVIPLRKQMIDLERLRFPFGVAVAEVLRSPGAAGRKSALLAGASGLALVVGLLVSFKLVPGKVDLGPALGVPVYVQTGVAISLLSVGAGYLSGRSGLVVLAGGILVSWILGPIAVQLGWVAAPMGTPDGKVHAAIGGLLQGQVARPLGIGFLVGGALAGVLVALPMMRAAFASLRGPRGGSDELDARSIGFGIAGSVVLLTAASYLGGDGIGLGRAVLVALLGTAWMWLAGIIVAQCAGMTGWSPVSGMALLAVASVLVASGGNVAVAVLVGAGVCVAISEGADMMTDLKTGHIVGSIPRRQQIAQVLTSWIGPAIAVATVTVLWSTVRFGPENPAIPAPQAVTLREVVATVQGGNVPLDKYAVGAAVSAALTIAVGSGAGVLVGLSMYLPLAYVLPYGIGCVAAMVVQRTKGSTWSGENGVPVAAGLLVGDSLAGVAYSLTMLARAA